ncbi:DUF6766 family protein [Streptomyces somaliensis]|uniref:Transmembrane protein n=1 Tax=Streptomyces somaliensis (strain ATCC 33201 / DSM 40738 / JCM 12659 / KCTC 9044 / NCTC 11332 / NRRL B-12077 / IP 733) TaxID=1134445 RepID=A0AA44DFB8_STRE0|nr:DUF6766 family protein [Streptomyces somaliensis]NKY15086.1 hypothetical protein [Streptomyces somaliensis DSM 40738]
MNRLLRFARDNGLSLVFGAGFLATVCCQALAGRARYDDEMRALGAEPVGLARYLASADFAVAVTENWQSEYLQFFLYLFGTVWLLQRGSPESKEMHKAGTESDEDQRVGPYAAADSPRWAAAEGLRRTLYSRSLGVWMCALFLGSWYAQSVSGAAAYGEERLRALESPPPWSEYLASSDFWGRTLQNWQSELLAIGSMAIFSVYLRQRGSPESKPVGASHGTTGVGG